MDNKRKQKKKYRGILNVVQKKDTKIKCIDMMSNSEILVGG